MTVGILPGEDADQANPDIVLPIPTGLGEGRNLVVVEASEALIAIGGGAGTLSEIGFALKLHKPLVLLGSWSFTLPEGAHPLSLSVERASTPEEAVRLAIERARQARLRYKG
jgi:hypothetical protein